MLKRTFDIAASVIGLILAAPIIIGAAIGVKLSSRGPAFFCPQRAGVGGRPFTLFKLRTMHVDQGAHAPSITGVADPRVFAFGSFLRKSKIDELPQLLNVLRGDMSLVGPRPEDMINVERYYDDLGMQTLTVRPGLSSIGSIYTYTIGEKMLVGENPAEIYARDLLPIKLALEAVYIRDASFGYDLHLMWRTGISILSIVLGRTEFEEPREMPAARELLTQYQTRAAA